LEGWSFEGATNYIGECAGHYMVGGYGNFGVGASMQKTYTNLPPHTQVRIRFQFWRIDSWDNEMFYCTVDGTKMDVHQGNLSEGTQLCGEVASWKEEVIDIELIVDH